jgi:hypothetical protein
MDMIQKVFLVQSLNLPSLEPLQEPLQGQLAAVVAAAEEHMTIDMTVFRHHQCPSRSKCIMTADMSLSGD